MSLLESFNWRKNVKHSKNIEKISLNASLSRLQVELDKSILLF